MILYINMHVPINLSHIVHCSIKHFNIIKLTWNSVYRLFKLKPNIKEHWMFGKTPLIIKYAWQPKTKRKIDERYF